MFILREALGFDYREIADMLGKNEANCRQLMSRARRKLSLAGEGPVATEAAEAAWVRRFITALEQGRIEAVLSLLAEDVVLVTDGGGKAHAAGYPIASRNRVAHFLVGMFGYLHARRDQFQVERCPLNGQTAVVVRSGDVPQAVAFMHTRHGKLANLYIVRNPDKLARVTLSWNRFGKEASP